MEKLGESQLGESQLGLELFERDWAFEKAGNEERRRSGRKEELRSGSNEPRR